jgi:hypothetical protein
MAVGLGVAATALVACGQPVGQLAGQLSGRGSAPGRFARSRGDEPPEARVDKARLEATMATLTGKKATPDGSLIKERGGSEGREFTRKFLEKALADLGYPVERHKYSDRGTNLLAHLPAESPTDEFILVGAHMDSVSNAGADDNGSGSTAVLEAATVLKDLSGRKVNVIFAWFDQEELGLVGSYKLAADFRKQKKKLSSVHTLDMVGWDADKDNAIEIERPDGALWDWYQAANKRHGLNYPLARTNSGSTDHVAFRAEGFTAVGLCEEWAGDDTTPHYHRKSDTYETINFDYLAAVTKLTVATVSDLTRKVQAPPASPRLPHNRFPGREHGFHPGGLDAHGH